MTSPAHPAPSIEASIDPVVHAALAKATASLSPVSAGLAAIDWATHLALSPGKQLELARLACSGVAAAACGMRAGSPGQQADCGMAIPHDRRFTDAAWERWPFSTFRDTFLLTEQWWDAATHGVWGIEPHHEQQAAFAARQWLDMLSPGNSPVTNPAVLRRTCEEGGMNLVRGGLRAAADLGRQLRHEPDPAASAFVVGRDVAATAGKVVLRNALIELIQYSPTTAKVHAEPILIVPAWIMKYYILDLSPANSLVRFLVDQGHTVFCISWKNPEREDAQLCMDDYLRQGWFAALDEVTRIVPKRRVHAAGYCLGGTLLAIAAAAMARDRDDRLASLTLFAAQTDFTEPGELGLFIDEDQVSLIEAQMARTGTLAGGQMAGAFQMLRSNDLIWSRLIKQYLLGEPATVDDLMAWNADTTRMPARMHSEYLRRLFLGNDLAEGRYAVGGRPVSLEDLHLPVFMVGTLTDHVAPWRSVFKLHHLCAAEITFVLTSGGHNAGIVSPPSHPGRTFRALRRDADALSLSADDWMATAPQSPGSWWPLWQAWLAQRSAPPVRPPRPGGLSGDLVCDAPGTYVMAQ